MAKYRIENCVVDTRNATACWKEDVRWDGRNNISQATGSQWRHQELYRSRRGRYYLECWSQWQESTPHAEWVSPEEAARWLLLNNHEIPKDLIAAASSIEE